MKNINTLLYLVLLFTAPLYAQRHDANWPLGFQEYPGQSAYGNAVIQFMPDTTVLAAANWNISFESAVAAMSDENGQLIFTSNGCTILTASGDTMDAVFWFDDPIALNPGPVHDLVCADYGYPAPQGMFVLPDPGNSKRYFLFHLVAQYHPEKKWSYAPFFYSVIDMAANNGDGQVVGNHIPLLGNDPLEPITALRHGNGRDWWIVATGRNTNYYVTFLLSPLGIKEYNFQIIGPPGDCPRIGSTVFSPDGRKYARTQNCRTIVFDFDRCTGLFSNPLVFARPNYVFGGGGVAFSPKGERLFVTEQLAVLSADLTDANPTLDTLIPSTEMIGVSLGLLQAAPDGRLYANSTHRSRYMASFKQSSDPDTDFQARSLFLGKYSARTLPHYPNYRLYDLPDSPCDTLGINTPVSTNSIPEKTNIAKVFPNPFQHSVTVYLESEIDKAAFNLYDQLGRLVQSKILLPGNHSLSTSSLGPGIYFWEISSKNGERQTGRLVKLEN